MLVEYQVVEPLLQVADRHLHKVRDAHSAYLDVFRFFLQARSVTVRTNGLAAIAAHHHAILNFVLVVFDHLEEGIDAHLLVDVFRVGGQPMPKPVFFLSRKVHVRLEDGELVARCPSAKLVLPLFHLVAVPALHAPFIDRECAVGNHQFLVDANHAAKAFARGTGAKRGIEREHVVVGLLKLDAVGLEACGKVVADIAREEHQSALSVALIESGLSRVQQSRYGFLVVIHRKTVDEQPQQTVARRCLLLLGLIEQRLVLYEIFNSVEFPFIEQPHVSLLDVHFKLFAERAVLGDV